MLERRVIIEGKTDDKTIDFSVGIGAYMPIIVTTPAVKHSEFDWAMALRFFLYIYLGAEAFSSVKLFHSDSRFENRIN